MLLIDSVHINNGGGKVLLDYFLKSFVSKSDEKVFILLDKRAQFDFDFGNNEIHIISSSIYNRFLFYFKNRKKFSKIFIFGNIPPPLTIRVKTFIYFHQELFLTNSYIHKNNLVLALKKLYIKLLSNHSLNWIVQTSNMKDLLNNSLFINNEKIDVIPIIPPFQNIFKKNEPSDIIKFIYVSDGYLHKNHKLLLEAFSKLNLHDKRVELHLTISSNFTSLISEINTFNNVNVEIFNHGLILRNEVFGLLSSCNYLIYPSLNESFGLGLVEANMAGLKVIAADLPYTHMVMNPSLIFNPTNLDSILHALNFSIYNDLPDSKALVFDETEKLINILLYKN